MCHPNYRRQSIKQIKRKVIFNLEMWLTRCNFFYFVFCFRFFHFVVPTFNQFASVPPPSSIANLPGVNTPGLDSVFEPRTAQQQLQQQQQYSQEPQVCINFSANNAPPIHFLHMIILFDLFKFLATNAICIAAICNDKW